MSAEAKGIRRNPVQEIFWTRTGLLLLLLLLTSAASMAISASMPAGTWKNVLTALATGTMVTAIVGFGQTLITANAAQRAMVTPLIEENRRALKELSAEYRSLNREFFPTHVFEASDEPDPAFNNLMMEDLRLARRYLFLGFSGRHAAARLLHSRAEWEFRAVIADPRERNSITGRARYLIRHEDAEVEYEAIYKRLHEEIHIGLVGLYLARSRCSRMDITVVADPPLDRLEMFDDSAWITLYSDTGPSTLYPRTLRFTEGSFIYSMERAEFSRIANSRDSRRFVIGPDTTRAEFLSQFEKITGTRLSEEQFLELERKFHEFRKEFSAVAELRS